LPCQDEPRDKAAPEYPLVLDRGNGEEVLVFDRDQPVRAMIAATLSDFGYKPIPVAELSDAEMILAAVRIAIVDLDKNESTGKAKIEALLAQRPSLKVVAMRTVNDGIAERKTLSDPFPVLEKPFKAEQLLGAVSLALSQTQLLEMVKAVHPD
jgi:DNA-binding NtrC family response regulator